MVKRPDHPDFWLISQALVDSDAVSDSGTEKVADVVNRLVDEDSLLYAARQRAVMAMRAVGLSDPSALSLLMGVWTDAFVAGAKFQHLKTSKAQEFTDPSEEAPS